MFKFKKEEPDEMVHTGGSGAVTDIFIDLVAGSLGAIALVYVGQPFDTIKVKMQTFPKNYTGTWHCVTETWKKEGIRRGFYAGTVPSLVANIAENSVLFAGYGACQKAIGAVIGENPDTLSTWQNGAAGALAAFFSSFVLCPTELVKCRLQAMREMKHVKGVDKGPIGPWGLTRKIVEKRGVTGLFQGLVSTLIREVPGYLFLFTAYEGTRQLLTPEGKTKDDIGPEKTMVAGAVAGVTFWTIMFPVDVVKSRVQVGGQSQPIVGTIRRIIHKEGLHTLYKGLTPSLIRTVPACGVMFLVYEYSKRALHRLIDSTDPDVKLH